MGFEDEHSNFGHLHRRRDDTGSKSIGQRVDELETRARNLEILLTEMRIEMKGLMVKMWVGSTLLAAIVTGLVEWFARGK